MPIFSPTGLQQGVARQVSGLRQLGLAELQRRKQLEDQMALLRFKEQIATEDPQQQLLRQFLGQFTGGQFGEQPTADIQPDGGVVQPTDIQPQLGGGFGGGQFIPVPSISPSGGIGIRFQEAPQVREERLRGRIVQRGELVEKRNKAREIRKIQKSTEDVTSQIRLIQQDVDDLLNDFLKIPQELRGPIQGRKTLLTPKGKFPFVGVAGPTARFFQTNKELAVYEDTRSFFLSNIARKLGGERGVLTDRDIERVEGLFPRITDKDDVAKTKVNRIREFIQRRITEAENRANIQIKRIEIGGSTTPLQESDLGIDLQLDTQINELLDQLER